MDNIKVANLLDRLEEQMQFDNKKDYLHYLGKELGISYADYYSIKEESIIINGKDVDEIVNEIARIYSDSENLFDEWFDSIKLLDMNMKEVLSVYAKCIDKFSGDSLVQIMGENDSLEFKVIENDFKNYHVVDMLKHLQSTRDRDLSVITQILKYYPNETIDNILWIENVLHQLNMKVGESNFGIGDILEAINYSDEFKYLRGIQSLQDLEFNTIREKLERCK